jgi:hypothetical protein
MTAQQFADKVQDAGIDIFVVEVDKFGGMAFIPVLEAESTRAALKTRQRVQRLASRHGLRLRGYIVWKVNGLEGGAV